MNFQLMNNSIIIIQIQMIILLFIPIIHSNNIFMITSIINKTINTQDTYSFQIFRNLNSTGPINSPIQNLSATDYLQILFPQQYSLTDGLRNCTLQGNPTTCQVQSNILKFTNFVTIPDKISYTFEAQNIKNAGISGKTNSLVMWIKKLDGSIIDTYQGSTVTLLPGKFESLSIVSPSVIFTKSQFTFNINPRNMIPSDGSLQINIPNSWKLQKKLNNYTIDESNFTFINGNLTGSPVSTIKRQGSSTSFDYVITITGLSPSQFDSQFNFKLTYILTPPVVDDPQTITVSSLTSQGKKIDESEARVEGLLGRQMSSSKFDSLGSREVNSKFIGRVQFIPSGRFDISSRIQITFPDQIKLQYTALSHKFIEVQVKKTGQKILLENITYSNSEINGQSIYFNFNDLTNPKTTAPTATFLIQIFRDGYLTQSSNSQTYSATPSALVSAVISVDNLQINKYTNGTVQISPKNELQANSYIQIEYSSSISIQNGQIGCGSYTCKNIDNRMEIKALSSGWTNGIISLPLTNLKMPISTKPTQYIVKTKDPNGYTVDKLAIQITAKEGTLQNTQILPNSKRVLESTSYSIQINPTSRFDKIKVVFPPQTSLSQTLSKDTCKKQTDTIPCSVNGNEVFFTLSATSSITLSIEYVQNPNSFKPTSRFQIVTYLDNYKVEQLKTSVTVQMNIETSFSQLNVDFASKKNSQETTATFSIVAPQGFPAGVIEIDFPAQLTLTNPTCTINSTNIDCTKAAQKVFLSYSFTGNRRILLKISGVKTHYSFKTTGKFEVKFQTSSSFKVASGSILGISNSEQSDMSVEWKGQGFLGQQQQIQLIMTLNGKQDHVIITIPSQFPAINTLICSPQVGSTCTKLDSRNINLTANDVTVSLNLTLETPTSESSSGFTLTSYQQTYKIQKGITLNWQPVCKLPCKSCNSTHCESCYTNTAITTKIIFDNGSCKSLCKEGFFIFNGACQACNSKCKTCIDQATNCLSCPTNQFLEVSNNICVAKCDTGKYGDTINNPNKCLTCSSTCQQCQNTASQCTKCENGKYLYSKTCTENCPAQTTITNQVSRSCDVCKSPCFTCSTIVSNCNSCITNYLLQRSSCVTQCSSNYFEVVGECKICQAQKCEQCANKIDQCGNCQTNFYLRGTQCVNASTCTSSNYFVDYLNQLCSLCPSICISCTSKTVCQTCQPTYLFYDNFCYQKCPDKTFKQGTNCNDCQNPCNTCQSLNQCLSCKQGFLQDTSCLTQCSEGKYLNNTDCISCTTCPTCSNQTYCLSCSPGLYLYQGNCLTSCPNTSYSQSSTHTCQTCINNCQTCTTSTQCTTCHSNYFLEGSQCKLECSKGSGYEGICYICGPFCSTCDTNTENCQKCQDKYYLENNRCKQTCSAGYAISGSACQQCSTLFNSCKTCNITHCLSCDQGNLFNGKCTNCTDGYFPIAGQCQVCPSQCTLCTSAKNCSLCSSNYYLQQNQCVSNCNQDKVQSGGFCVRCSDGCSKCDKQTFKCVLCKQLLVFKGECSSICPQNYTISRNQTNCVDELEYALEDAQSAKFAFFPFFLTSLAIAIFIIVCKIMFPQTKLSTSLISFCCLFELASWITLTIIIFFDSIIINKISFIPGILSGMGVAILLILNIGHFIYYRKHVRQLDQINSYYSQYPNALRAILVLSIINFRVWRVINCQLLGRPRLSLKIPQLKAFSTISIIYLCLCVPFILASSVLTIIFTPTSQLFYQALDVLVLTIILSFVSIYDFSFTVYIKRLFGIEIEQDVRINKSEVEEVSVRGMGLLKKDQKGRIQMEDSFQIGDDKGWKSYVFLGQGQNSLQKIDYNSDNQNAEAYENFNRFIQKKNISFKKNNLIDFHKDIQHQVQARKRALQRRRLEDISQIDSQHSKQSNSQINDIINKMGDKADVRVNDGKVMARQLDEGELQKKDEQNELQQKIQNKNKNNNNFKNPQDKDKYLPLEQSEHSIPIHPQSFNQSQHLQGETITIPERTEKSKENLDQQQNLDIQQLQLKNTRSYDQNQLKQSIRNMSMKNIKKQNYRSPSKYDPIKVQRKFKLHNLQQDSNEIEIKRRIYKPQENIFQQKSQQKKPIGIIHQQENRKEQLTQTEIQALSIKEFSSLDSQKDKRYLINQNRYSQTHQLFDQQESVVSAQSVPYQLKDDVSPSDFNSMNQRYNEDEIFKFIQNKQPSDYKTQEAFMTIETKNRPLRRIQENNQSINALQDKLFNQLKSSIQEEGNSVNKGMIQSRMIQEQRNPLFDYPENKEKNKSSKFLRGRMKQIEQIYLKRQQ